MKLIKLLSPNWIKSIRLGCWSVLYGADCIPPLQKHLENIPVYRMSKNDKQGLDEIKVKLPKLKKSFSEIDIVLVHISNKAKQNNTKWYSILKIQGCDRRMIERCRLIRMDQPAHFVLRQQLFTPNNRDILLMEYQSWEARYDNRDGEKMPNRLAILEYSSLENPSTLQSNSRLIM